MIAVSIGLTCLFSAEIRATYFPQYACKQVQFTSRNTGWIIGTRGIYKTEDGGVTWRQLQTLPYHLSMGIPPPPDPEGNIPEEDPNALGNGAAISAVGWFVDDEFGYYGTADGDGGLVRTTDGGDSWTELLPGILKAGGLEDQFKNGWWGVGGMSIVSRDVGWFLIDHLSMSGELWDTDFRVLSRTTDGGGTFEFAPLDLGRWPSLVAFDDSIALLSNYRLDMPSGMEMLLSDNGGTTWARTSLPPCKYSAPILHRFGSTIWALCRDLEPLDPTVSKRRSQRPLEAFGPQGSASLGRIPVGFPILRSRVRLVLVGNAGRSG